MKRLLSFSMKRQTPVAALGALVLSIVLSGCEKPDLRLEQVQIDWGAGAKTVTARISNYGSADAGRFVVRFVGEELPQSAGSAPQVLRDVPGLDNGTDLLVTADFTPLASAANSDLWHVRRIAVQVDANREVSEKREDNNDGGRNVLNSDLPVVIVDPFGISIPIEPKTPAAFRIIDDSSASNNYNGAVGIEVRGASSSTFCQKQYGLEVWEAANDDDDVDIPLLGMPKEEDWILHGPYTDKTLLRNALVYQGPLRVIQDTFNRNWRRLWPGWNTTGRKSKWWTRRSSCGESSVPPGTTSPPSGAARTNLARQSRRAAQSGVEQLARDATPVYSMLRIMTLAHRYAEQDA